MQAAFVGTVPLSFLKDAKAFTLIGFESLDNEEFDWNMNVTIIFYLFYEQRYFGISQTCNMKELSTPDDVIYLPTQENKYHIRLV